MESHPNAALRWLDSERALVLTAHKFGFTLFRTMQFFGFFVICFFLEFKTSEEYLTQKLVIDRSSFQSVNNSTMVDGFRKMILLESNVDCSEFNAEIRNGMDSDRCVCNEESATFSLFDEKWQCTENEDFREREGMLMKKEY